MSKPFASRLVLNLLLLVCVVSLASLPASAAKVKLRVMTHINSPELVDEHEALIRKFEEIFPDVEIELISAIWDDYHDQLLTMYLGGIAPDVMSIGRLELASFADSGILLPLDRFIEADQQFDIRQDVLPGLMASGYFAGQVYGFPIYNGPSLLFYNPGLFEQAGLESPVRLVAQDGWNRSAFLNAAQKLTQDADGDGRPEQFGFSGYTTWEATWVPFIRNAGGDVLNEQYRSVLNSPETKDGLNWLNAVQLNSGVVGGSWEAGTQAMAIRWMSSGLVERNIFENFGPEPALLPAGPAGHAHLAGGVPVAVSHQTAHPQIAYEFAKWLAMESGIWHLRGGPPLSWEAIQAPEFRRTLDIFDHPEVFEMALSLGDSRPEPQFGVVDYQRMTSILHGTLITPIRSGRTPVDVAVEEAHRLLNQLLSH